MENADSWFSCVLGFLVTLSTLWATFEAELVEKRFLPFHASLEISGLITTVAVGRFSVGGLWIRLGRGSGD